MMKMKNAEEEKRNETNYEWNEKFFSPFFLLVQVPPSFCIYDSNSCLCVLVTQFFINVILLFCD